MPSPSITPAADTHIGDTVVNDTQNFGAAQTFFLGTSFFGIQFLWRALLRFDLTPYLDQTLTAASLTLKKGSGNVTNQTFTLHRLTQTAWTEMGATWLKRDGATNWTTPGGDFDAAPAASVFMPAAVDLVFPNLIALCQDAINFRGGMLNLLIKGDAGSGTNLLEPYTREVATAALRPTLSLSYTQADLYKVDFHVRPSLEPVFVLPALVP